MDTPPISAVEPPSATKLHQPSQALWQESLDTPGYIPRHLKYSASTQFPILEVIQRLLHRLKPSGGDLEKVLALIGLYQAVRPAYHCLQEFCLWAFTVRVTIPEHDPVARDVLAWIGSHVIRDSFTRDAMLVTGGIQDINDEFHRRMMRPVTVYNSRQQLGKEKVDDEVLCLPPIGTRLFCVGFRPMLFSRRGGIRGSTSLSLDTHSGELQNSLILTTPGWSLKPLQDFIAVCHDFRKKHMSGTTTVFFAGSSHDALGGDNWQSVSKAVRKLDTIDMDEDVKLDIIKDAEYYYSDQSRQYFADCGIPYRRGYLFHGPPGTGKSSFSAALAGHLKCDIYHINLSSGGITDGKLHRLFLGLPRKCIVVIEDIDSAGIGREAPPEKPAFQEIPFNPMLTSSMREMMEQQMKAGSKQKGSLVTLSGLLNAIDGNASQEGRLLIMTSNNPDSLDDALTRPGRIDKKVHFGNISKMAAQSIFKRLIGRSAFAHDAALNVEQIEQYASEFAHKIPDNVFSPAQIQNFLQDCRGDPDKALAKIESWVAKNWSRHVKTSKDNHSVPHGFGRDVDSLLAKVGSFPVTPFRPLLEKDDEHADSESIS